MSKVHLLANSKILEGILIIWGIFQDSVALTLLTDGFNEILSLDDFVEKQLNNLQKISKNFKDSIQETLEGVMTSTISHSLSVQQASEKNRYQGMVSLTQKMLHNVLLQITHKTINKYQSLNNRWIDR